MKKYDDHLAIEIPKYTDDMPIDGPWSIKAPWLKLGLKYGFIENSPWSPTSTNRSVAFDRYALTRGPETGPPTLTDLSVTLLMNSRVTGGDITRMSGWIARNRTEVLDLWGLLRKRDSFLGLTDEDLINVGGFVDSISSSDSALKVDGVARAKTTKWLSTWALSHVPMLDGVVEKALKGYSQVPTIKLLRRFRMIVDYEQNLQTLLTLGRALSMELGFDAPVPPIRVLEQLIWFDWAGGYKFDEEDEEFAFHDWFGLHSEDEATCHVTKDYGLDWLEKHGI